jgi:hypothetical protein
MLKPCTVRVRVSPRALTQGRSIKAMRRAPTPCSRQRDECLFESGRPCQTFPHGGVYANGQSGLVFNQSPERLCGFESRHPCQTLPTLAVAQRAERCTVDAVRCGFESRRPTFQPTRGVSQARSKARDSLSRKRGSESRTPCQLSEERWPRGLGTGLSIQTTRVRFSSAPPSHRRRKLNRHEHPPLKRGAAGSSPARRIGFRSVA